MFMLYQKQQDVVNKLMLAYQNPILNEGHLYLSGEMGTGKTYITCGLLKQTNTKKALVVCPASVTNKWKNVYEKFTNKPAVIANKNNFTSLIDNDFNGLIIVKQRDIISCFAAASSLDDSTFKNELAKYAQKGRSNYLECENYIDLNLYCNNFNTPQHYIIENINTLKMDPKLQNLDMVIFDEIHTYKPGHQDFSAYVLMTYYNKTLALTGTIFDQNISNLLALLLCSNKRILDTILSRTNSGFSSILKITNDGTPHIQANQANLQTEGNSSVFEYSFFIENIWRKIAVKINLNQINKERKNKINQKIMPLHGLKLTPIQKAWYDLANTNLKALNYSSAQADLKITSYLDLPSKVQPIITHTCQYLKYSNIMATTLLPIKLTETAKYNQLRDILKNNEKTIIFVQSEELLANLVKVLPNAFKIPKSMTKSKIASYINEKFKTYDTAVIIPRTIAVGVDLNSASRVIWYQVPSDISTILQAQRRVLRANSTQSSKVYYLFYEDTKQADIIHEASKASVRNSAAYSIRDTSSLAKVTQMLFEGIDGLENERTK